MFFGLHTLNFTQDSNQDPSVSLSGELAGYVFKKQNESFLHPVLE